MWKRECGLHRFGLIFCIAYAMRIRHNFVKCSNFYHLLLVCVLHSS